MLLVRALTVLLLFFSCVIVDAQYSLGIDTATPQANLNFGAARAAGYQSCYVKLGGDNVPRYVAPYYVAQVDAARNAGFRVGHYWVPSAAMDPTGAADYFVDHLRGWTGSDFVVLDNESLDGAQRYGDAAAAAWIARVKARLNIGGFQAKLYLGLSDARSNSWDSSLSTGCDFIIAAYSYAPFSYNLEGRIPPSRNNGHQTGQTTIAGVVVDVDYWKPGAFNYTPGPPGPPIPPPPAGWAFNPPDQATQARIQRALAARGRYDGPVDGVWGVNSIKGIQITCENVGYSGPVDGVPGPETCYYVQVYAAKFGSYTGPIDKILGPNSWDGFALGLERP